MAVGNRQKLVPDILIHHSDRGVQYCSAEYVQILMKEKIAISMTQTGSPYENAVAERVNGTIKNDFFPKRIYENHLEAKKAIAKIIDIYNQMRPHASLDYLTPDQAHAQDGPIKKRWKHYRLSGNKKEVNINDLV